MEHRISKEQYQQLKAAWKKMADGKYIAANDIIIYNLLRGKPLDNGFQKTTNYRKIRGNDEWYGFHTALRSINTNWNPDGWNRSKELLEKQFKTLYGFDCPEWFFGAIQEIKKHG